MSQFAGVWVCSVPISSGTETHTNGFYSAGFLSQSSALGSILKLLLFNKERRGWLKYKYLMKKEEEKKSGKET